MLSLLRLDKSLCLPKLKSIIVLLYDFSTKIEMFYFQNGASVSEEFALFN